MAIPTGGEDSYSLQNESISVGKVGKFLAGGGVVGTVLNSVMKQPKSTTPAQPTPIVMPTADDAAVQEAKRRSLAAQAQRSGRMSTLLSDGNDSGGTTLG